jgi:hypothetical protein
LAVIYDAQGRGIDTNNPLPIKHSASDIIQPVEIQSKYAQTIQTHNAVSVPLSNYSNGSWIDCDGFSDIGVTFVSDSNTLNSSISLHWSNDGSTKHGDETLVATSTPMFKQGVTSIKSRYVRVVLGNQDSALAHTMSAWAYLKA